MNRCSYLFWCFCGLDNGVNYSIASTPNAVSEINNNTLAPRIVSVFYPSQDSENLYPIDIIAQFTAWAYHHGSSGSCSGGGNMMDIARDAAIGHGIRVYVNYPIVKSVAFERVDSCCPCTQNTRNAVKVHLYGQYNKNCYLGTILYGHMTNPTNSYWINLGGSYAGQIGNVLGTDYCSCYGNPTTGTGAHVHTEVWGGTRLPFNGQYVYQGSTAIYRWNALC